MGATRAETDRAHRQLELAMADLARATKRGIDQRELAIEIGSCRRDDHACDDVVHLARLIVEAREFRDGPYGR